ncbi:LysR family transcriptional regulator [Agarivorans sp. 1_MG-2023]|uniref:LysR family transcriptional regulator n=1 Tax=Agarivorans sp. 1_MG-2023 TaxID=3062634 RepID=UPI0026E19AEC|nr:LysR family transcriptional regulator [Agarivorans sp. 1_MG-2023]MDO6762983.1 LysR family transcriptional regulator [Agarivorans sp. 1_MG-2023]
MDFSLAQLQAFVLTYETGSFKSAAIKAGKRSQAIAKLVATLEESCDVLLFERHVRRLEVTDEAKKLYKLSKRVLLDSDQISTMLSSFDEDLPSSLTLAIDSLLISDVVTKSYKAVLDEIPTLDLALLTGNTDQVAQWVKDGTADMGLRASPFNSEDELTVVSAFNFKTLSVASPNVLSSGSVMNKSDLSRLIQIVPKFVYEYGLADGHVISDKVITSNNLQNTLAMVEAGMGWAVVPEFNIHTQLANQSLVEFSIEGSVPVVWTAEIIYSNDDNLSLAGDIFIQQIQQIEPF